MNLIPVLAVVAAVIALVCRLFIFRVPGNPGSKESNQDMNEAVKDMGLGYLIAFCFLLPVSFASMQFGGTKDAENVRTFLLAFGLWTVGGYTMLALVRRRQPEYASRARFMMFGGAGMIVLFGLLTLASIVTSQAS